MPKVMKTFLLTVLAVFGLLPLGWAYSLEGPVGNGGDRWQTGDTGYGPTRDTVAPKNLGEEYRRNVPVLYYACDQSFLDYFGSRGEMAIDNAFAVLNKVFTNNPTGIATGLDGYSLNLSDFPLTAHHLNYQAQALGLFDLKTYTLGMMMGQLGLADPTYYVWGLHDWYHVGNVSCPVGQEYLVVQRNFDFTSSPLNQLQYSPYINDTLYSYDIIEDCSPPPTPDRWAQPYPVDILSDAYTPLASQLDYGLWGQYYTGLTRDDVAGLRYLMAANNINWETVSADSLQDVITTNTATPEVFPPYVYGATNFFIATNGAGYYVPAFTNATGAIAGGYGDLGAFLAFAHTNDPATLQAAYPGLVITTNSYTASIVSNAYYVAYYTNAPIGSPYGSPPVLVIATNYNLVFQFTYHYTFANLFTNHYAQGASKLVTVSVGAPVGSPYGTTGVTNTTVRNLPTISGDFFILPLFYTNVCPIDILPYGTITNVLATTNLVSTAFTNTVATTNSAATNLTSYVYLINYFTNYSYVIAPVTCSTIAGATGLYEGIEKIQFVGTSYDSWLGQFFQPITNYYTLKSVTNGQVQVQYFERIVTRPDYRFAASDQVAGPGGVPVVGIETHDLNFDQANILPGLAGPGTIQGPSTITFEKAGPVFYNSYATVMDGTPYFTETPEGDNNPLTSDQYFLGYFVWASFDGTTNAPVVYPNGTSIDNLENQILVNVTPATVPAGRSGVTYTPVTFTAASTFFAQPYSWSASGLPAGLSLSPDGTLSGTPTQSGNFVFTLTLTDNLSRSVQWYYSITIQ